VLASSSRNRELFATPLIVPRGEIARKDCFGATLEPARETRVLPTVTIRSSLFLHDLGVLDHRNSAALSQLAFHGDGLAAVLSELIVHWLVFANDQICFAIADDAGWPAALDALGSAGLAMLLANGIMIDIAHHIDYFASHFFRSGRIAAMLVFLRNGQGSAGQSCDEGRRY
jgi:hypothetical protein